MDSMTEDEMEDPRVIKGTRINRIAYGAGVDPHDVRELIKQYAQSKKAMKTFMGDRKMRKKILKQMGSGDLDI
jgi:signal recognition particle subunit SRP54